jgi:hypothetical protein
MKPHYLVLLTTSTLLAGCGPDKLLSDQYSPSRQYHVEVRSCPTPGGRGDSAGTFQVSLLPGDKSEGCWDEINSFAQFKTDTPDIQLEWLSDTQLRVWVPGWKGPFTYNHSAEEPVHFVFAPKK